VYRLSNSVRSAHTKDGATVLDIAQGRMFSLNSVGSRIFELLKNDRPLPEIVAEMVREFARSRELAEADVREFIRSLKEFNLVEEIERPSPLAKE
jgi:Coenzyme PQQ synthesis protein D (PqqD)